jgi:uncharacterized protein (TIGR03435 family)
VVVAGMMLWLMPSGLFRGQSQAQTFSVISIKQAPDCRNLEWPLYRPGGRYKNCGNLDFLIKEAYRLTSSTPLEGIPDWSKRIRYEIEAKAEGNPNVQQMHLMVQLMLEDRFKLKMHSERRETRVYFLSVAKGGNKLQPSKDENGNPITSLPSDEEINSKLNSPSAHKKFKLKDELIAAMPSGSRITGINVGGGSEFFGKAMTMKYFAESLSSRVENTPVIDKTGLIGLYDINLKVAPPNLVTNSPISSEEPSASDIFGALRDQLGLKLELGKGLVDHFIIDSVNRPPEN